MRLIGIRNRRRKKKRKKEKRKNKKTKQKNKTKKNNKNVNHWMNGNTGRECTSEEDQQDTRCRTRDHIVVESISMYLVHDSVKRRKPVYVGRKRANKK